MQTGRSLAGICYGGCIFMGDSIEPRSKRNVDYALSFLAKDASEFEDILGNGMKSLSQGSNSIEEIWSVVDGLLTCLSQIISGSCQHFIKANNQLKDQKEKQNAAFESIA